MAWDATIVHTSAQSYRHLTAIEPGSAAAESRKTGKYALLNGTAVFYPVGLDTLGPFGPSTKRLFEGVAAKVRARTGDPTARARLIRRIATAVQIGNAACIIEAHSRLRDPSRQVTASPFTSGAEAHPRAVAH